jgi:hypothetical protein
MADERRPSGIDRRRLLKRIGAGAAIVWVAPVIDSVVSEAAAGSVPPSCQSQCGSPGICIVPCGPGCLCGPKATGGCACFIPLCGGPACGVDTDCPNGWACVAADTCCGSPVPAFCAPLCGTPLPDQRVPATATGWVAA